MKQLLDYRLANGGLARAHREDAEFARLLSMFQDYDLQLVVNGRGGGAWYYHLRGTDLQEIGASVFRRRRANSSSAGAAFQIIISESVILGILVRDVHPNDAYAQGLIIINSFSDSEFSGWVVFKSRDLILRLLGWDSQGKE